MNDPSWISVLQQAIVNRGPRLLGNLIAFLLILLAGKIVIQVTSSLVDRILKRSPRFNDMLRNLAVDVLSKALWVVVFVIALGQLGIDVAPLIAGLGIAGFVIGFAFKDALGNLASGMMILLNNPFNVNDFVEVADHQGKVVELNLMATILTTPDNKRITIPNSTVWGSSIVNFTANDTRRVDMVFGIGYEDDIPRARSLLEDVLEENEHVLREPEPTIEVTELADSSVNFVVRPWAETENYWKVYRSVTRAVKETFDASGISIPYPQRDVHLDPSPPGTTSQ